MNEAEIPIDISTLKLQDWLVSRRIVPKSIQTQLRDVRTKIQNALQDMPSNDDLIKLLSGKNINYFTTKEIIEILKQTEKDTKSVFGTYGSQRMKDWQEIVRLYEKDNIYLGETAQIFVRNVNYEIPNVRKQMKILEQQSEDCIKKANDLHKPEALLLNDHAALLQQIGVKGENLKNEFIDVLKNLSELYADSISNIGTIAEAVNLYGDTIKQKQCLPLLRHLIDVGNTTVYQYIHKEAPLSINEPEINLNLSEEHNNQEESVADNEIDFGIDDNGGTASTVSGEMIDFSEFTLDNNGSNEMLKTDPADIDWGDVETSPTDSVEVNFDIPIEEYGIVVKGTGMDGGIAKGDQAYSLLDSQNYRHRILDEIFELEAFLKMRTYELSHSDASTNIMFSLMDNFSTHDSGTTCKMLKNVESTIKKLTDEHIQHLFQLKHSSKYADLLANKLQQMMKAVDKIRANREYLKEKSVQLSKERQNLNPVLDELIAQTKELQLHIQKDISKRYKNRTVNLIGSGI